MGRVSSLVFVEFFVFDCCFLPYFITFHVFLFGVSFPTVFRDKFGLSFRLVSLVIQILLISQAYILNFSVIL